MKKLCAALILLSVCACAGPIETRVDSLGAGVGTDTPRTFQLAQNPTEVGPDNKAARDLIVQEMANKGYSYDPAGAYYLEITIATMPADLTLKDSNNVLSQAKKKKPFQNCKDVEFRLGVALTRVADGVQMYKSSASEYHCNASFQDSLPALVTAILAYLSAPKGAYVLKRSGRE